MRYKMNINKITQKVIKDSLTDEFIVAMLISYLSDDQKGAIMDEIVNEREHILFKKGDIVWFDPKDNKYDLKDCYEDDIMRDALCMNKDGHIKGIIIGDTSYRDTCDPYAPEYKIKVQFAMIRTGSKVHVDPDKEKKEVRVNRSNIIGLWKGLE